MQLINVIKEQVNLANLAKLVSLEKAAVMMPTGDTKEQHLKKIESICVCHCTALVCRVGENWVECMYRYKSYAYVTKINFTQTSKTCTEIYLL